MNQSVKLIKPKLQEEDQRRKCQQLTGQHHFKKNHLSLVLILIITINLFAFMINQMNGVQAEFFDCNNMVIRKPARFGKRFIDDNDNVIKREMIETHPCVRFFRRNDPTFSTMSSKISTNNYHHDLLMDDWTNNNSNHDNNKNVDNVHRYFNEDNNHQQQQFRHQSDDNNDDDDGHMRMVNINGQKLPKKMILKVYSILYRKK